MGTGSSFVLAAIDDIEMRLLSVISILCLAARCADCRALDADSKEETARYKRKFTVEELLNTKFPHAISGDLDADICKAGKRRRFYLYVTKTGNISEFNGANVFCRYFDYAILRD